MRIRLQTPTDIMRWTTSLMLNTTQFHLFLSRKAICSITSVLWFFINIYWSMRSCIVQIYIISLLSSRLLCMISNYIFLFYCWLWNKLLNNGFEIKSVNMLIFLQVFLQKWVLVVISFKYWYLRKAYTSTQIEN